MNNQQKFDEIFKENFTSVYEMVEDASEYGDNILKLDLVSEKREDVSDSYDFTDDVLENVYYHKELDLYIKVKGRDVSYSGESWEDEYTFVLPQTKEITTYE